MGLDMYLSATRSFYPCDWDKKDTEEKRKNKQIRKMFPELNFTTGNLDYIRIEVEIGYWRKANQIHAWFVKNVQDGEDDCKDYHVSRDDLKKLKEICETIMKKSELEEGMVQNGTTYKNGKAVPFMEKGKYIKNPEVAQELLPTESGFFFGSTDYNQWYIKDIENTIEIIDRCLKLPDDWSFEYNSSW